MTLPYKYSQLDHTKRITFQESVAICKGDDALNIKTWHFGQMKLFYSEMLFFTKYAQPGDRVVYVGAAAGYHTNLIAELFPQLKFDLYDKNPFKIDDKWIKSGQIQLFKEYFTDTHAENYALSDERILFLCDMRDLNIGKHKSDDSIDEADIIVMQDMVDQMRWAQIIKPVMVYLKFRLPYEVQNFDYLAGTIYLQTYTSISTEARLCTHIYDKVITYDAKEFDEVLAYHNAYNRCLSKTYPQYEPITSKYGIINNWDNCYALMIIGNYLQRYRGKSSVDSMGKLFMKIHHFHKSRLRDPYDLVFKGKV